MKNTFSMKKEYELYMEEQEHNMDEYFSFVDNDWHFYDATYDFWECPDCIIYPDGTVTYFE